MQTRQPVFVQLLGAAFRVSQCSWLTVDQRVNVENCIRTLSEVAKARSIAIPSDLDIQVETVWAMALMTKGDKFVCLHQLCISTKRLEGNRLF